MKCLVDTGKTCSNSDFANWNNWNKSHFFRKKPS